MLYFIFTEFVSFTATGVARGVPTPVVRPPVLYNVTSSEATRTTQAKSYRLDLLLRVFHSKLVEW